MRSRMSGASPFNFQRGVDAGHQALAGSFFVAAGSVDLAGEVKLRNLLGFKRTLQLSRVDGIVFDGVAGAQHLSVFEARH